MSQHYELTDEPISSVSVVGLGYIGLPTAAFIAGGGTKVLGVDVNQKTVDTINSGHVPFSEPGFEQLLAKVVADGMLSAATSPAPADAFIVAVPTPFKSDHSVDTVYIEAAARSLAPVVRPGNLVVLESTSPPGTTELMAKIIMDERPDLSLDEGADNALLVAHCPERVIPGNIMVEMVTNDRVVGGITPAAAQRARELYSTFCRGEILLTDAKTAEMAKLTENSFRDVNIAFANELSLICDDLGINVWELIELANHHPRVNILRPGPGVGGHCIAVDPWFIVAADPKNSRLIRTAREVNDSKPDWVVEQVTAKAATLTNPTIAVLGITFKANIDDLRESPSIRIAERIASIDSHPTVLVVEPNIDVLPDRLSRIDGVTKADLRPALDAADIVVLLVDHAEFTALTRKDLGDAIVIDTKGIWS